MVVSDGSNPDRYEFDGFAFIGRTFGEYEQMLGLADVDLDGTRVLDCPGGACGFTAGATARGADAYAVDPAYALGFGDLAARGRADAARAVDGLDGVEQLYRWEFYDDPADLSTYRRAALARFLAHRRAAPGRYVAGGLPDLPFADDAFDLVCSAHLLFLYADRLDHAFHAAALRELCRVARDEVRVFPLHDFGADRYDGLDDLRLGLERDGYDPHVESVPFEFQRGADACLRIEV
ncbi:methyltransferase domain-containing protein [Halobaculum limi]|uniref:methyltransferase domain-containing protein n=1 Tax=Halobaculum limi TaxID=3031916 RepID=UPI0024060411|nr:methyltransferase domain-containing protein [Halobaculum sp. YSMS11]